MKICYRDDLGLNVTEVSTDTAGISFDGRYAYFTDTENRDYRISVQNIVMIGKEV